MQTKRLLSFFIGLVCCLALQAQDRVWEIGWQLYNSHPVPTGLEMVHDPGPAFLNGILIKHQSTGFKQRLNLQYLNLLGVSDLDDGDRCCRPIEEVSSYKGIEVSVGIEKAANNGPLQGYAIFDLGFGFGSRRQISPFLFSSSQGPDMRYRSIGAYPGAGLNLRIRNRININWELRWPGVLYKSKGRLQQGSGAILNSEGVRWQKRPESMLGVLVSI